MNLQPNRCNLCGGKVIYTSNTVIYGKEYGSGKCYLCTKCKAYVGTHKPRPKEALGILANKEMRDMKQRCHKLFDAKWKNRKERQKLYKALAEKLDIPVSECHFGYFDLIMLNKAYDLLKDDKI